MASAVRHATESGASVNACAVGIYRRRHPDKTLAYQIVHGWLATWLALHEAQDVGSVPAVVERELSGYLECGILAHGFARARCSNCTAEFLLTIELRRQLRLQCRDW